jgi:hypothetical protein
MVPAGTGRVVQCRESGKEPVAGNSKNREAIERPFQLKVERIAVSERNENETPEDDLQTER